MRDPAGCIVLPNIFEEWADKPRGKSVSTSTPLIKSLAVGSLRCKYLYLEDYISIWYDSFKMINDFKSSGCGNKSHLLKQVVWKVGQHIHSRRYGLVEYQAFTEGVQTLSVANEAVISHY